MSGERNQKLDSFFRKAKSWREERMADWLVYVPDSVLKAASLNPDYSPPELTSRDAVREALLRASQVEESE